ncbi:MAG: hypothetical protein G01um101438_972 [Parcubacteria group bacterium Gr01-1014_38]|nr:MAG: hypothetical protein G01um101438_972 [Parcubacteria group bacterium Gr01-1014_38]
MQFKQTIHQVQPEREYRGKFIFGEKEFAYNLLFRVPTSKMDEECEKRQKAGQDVSSIKVKRKLFTLTVKNGDGKNLDLSDDETYGLLVHLAGTMAADVSGHILTEGFNEMFGGVLEESFTEHSRELELNEEVLPVFLKEQLDVQPTPTAKKPPSSKRRKKK